MTQTYKYLILSFLLICCSFQLKAAAEDPGFIVKRTVDNVLSVLDDESLNEDKKKEIIFKLVDERIHFEDMSRRILATNWKAANDEQKAKFISLFKEILLNTYWIRIRQYSGERVDYITVNKDNENYATVDTVIVRSSSNVQIPISYRMKRLVDVWYAYDFIVENLSLVQSYRNEYRAIVKNFGIDGLLEHMQRDIDAMNSAS